MMAGVQFINVFYGSCFEDISVLNDMKLQAYLTWTGKQQHKIMRCFVWGRDCLCTSR